MRNLARFLDILGPILILGTLANMTSLTNAVFITVGIVIMNVSNLIRMSKE